MFKSDPKLTARIAAAFLGLVGLVMLVNHLNSETIGPLKSPALAELKSKLRLNPMDESLKQQVRQLDLELRGQYFRQLSQMSSGVYLILAGAAVFLFSFKRYARANQLPPMPKPENDDAGSRARQAAGARWAVAGTGAAVAVLLLALSAGFTTALPQNPAGVDKLLGADTAATASDAASPEEMKLNWPRFRGADGGGISAFTNYPISWQTNVGKGLAWKIPSPSHGFNSPIAWGDRIYFSGGNATLREVLCLDAKTGAIAWRQAVTNVPGSPTGPLEIPESTGYAAATMATDGRRVYAMFANGDLAAFSLDGKLAWSKGFGALKNPYGHATSLATWQDRVILQLDQGDSEEAKSRLYALDGRTGKVVWQRPRKVGGSWASPIVFEAAGKAQILALAVPNAVAYAATDGAELWRADCLNGEITPSPIFAGGLAIVISPSEKVLAIRPDGHGDVTKTHVAWTAEENVPDITCPVSTGELVFTLSSSGMLTCFDGKDGKKVWDHDFDTEFHSSPSLAGNRLYLFGEKGAAVVVEAGRQFKELFRTEMGDGFHASPAFLKDRIIVRGVNQIWCLSNAEPGGAAAR